MKGVVSDEKGFELGNMMCRLKMNMSDNFWMMECKKTKKFSIHSLTFMKYSVKYRREVL